MPSQQQREAIEAMARVVEDISLSHSPRPATFLYVRPDQWAVIKAGLRAAQALADPTSDAGAPDG